MTNQYVAIVTGGSSGIGFGIAKKFTQQGWITIITGRNKEKLEAAAQELGDNAVAVQLDMDALGLIPSFVSGIMEKYGRIDVLVNNAGINMKKNLIEVTDEDFQKIIHTNLTAVFAMSREVVKHMIPQAKGVIIHISSMAAHYGLPKVIAYSASKTALEGMTRAMAVELSPLGIRVNCVAPGFIRTNMTAKALDSDPERKAKVFARTPMGDMGDPADIANMVHFLASEGAAYVTGETIKVDGGNSIGF